jgi:hypothetical protein
MINIIGIRLLPVVLGPWVYPGCVASGTADALVLIEGRLDKTHRQCSASVGKTTFQYSDRTIEGPFKLDYTAGPSDNWFEIKIHCADGASFKRRFDKLATHLEMGNL